MTINDDYTITANFSLIPSTGGGGGGGGGATAGVADLSDAIEPNGKLLQEKRDFSINEEAFLLLPAGTFCTLNGAAISFIYILPLDNTDTPPPVPDYDVTVARIFKFGPEGVQFNPPVPLTFNYKQTLIPDGIDETSLYIAWWDTQTKQWVRLETHIDADKNTAEADISHFSMYTLMADTRIVKITGTAISITPEEIHEGQQINISATLYNSGNVTGDYDAILKLNGVAQETKKVTVPPSENVTMNFTLDGLDSGTYVITIGDLTKSITVLLKIPLTPASFEISSVNISSKEIDVGENVTISVNVTNTGESEGSYSVTFKANTAVLGVKDISLAGKANQAVSMTTSFDTPGKKLIEVNGLLDSLQVRGEVPPPSQVPLPLEATRPSAPSAVTPSQSALPVNQGTTSGINWIVILSVAGGCLVLAVCIFYFAYWRRRSR